MNLFLSLGSNFRFTDAVAHLFAFGSKSSQSRLKALLSEKYDGEAELFYKGRNALAAAIEAATEKGDKVAVNGFTCYAVAQAVMDAGRVPVYLDIREEDLHFGAKELEESLTKDPDIKVVVVQNTLGKACDIVAIEEIAKRKNLIIIEDLAHSIDTKYSDGRIAGSVGDFVMMSFGRDKIIDVVNGGALITRNKTLSGKVAHPSNYPALSDRLRDRWYPLLAWKVRVLYGIGLGKLLQKIYMKLGMIKRSADGEIKTDQGLPGWYCSRVLKGFDQLDSNLANRKRIVDVYASGLTNQTKQVGLLRLGVLVSSSAELLKTFRNNGIYLYDIWYDTPIYPGRFMASSGYEEGSCPVAVSVARRIINLPTHQNVSKKHVQKLIRITNELSS